MNQNHEDTPTIQLALLNFTHTFAPNKIQLQKLKTAQDHFRYITQSETLLINIRVCWVMLGKLEEAALTLHTAWLERNGL